MKFENLFDDKKTTYTIIDENGDKSSITIDKWAADLLQESLSDVHVWIQSKFDLVCLKKPNLTRREKGDVVRALAQSEAMKNPNYVSLSDFL